MICTPETGDEHSRQFHLVVSTSPTPLNGRNSTAAMYHVRSLAHCLNVFPQQLQLDKQPEASRVKLVDLFIFQSCKLIETSTQGFQRAIDQLSFVGLHAKYLFHGHKSNVATSIKGRD